MNFVPSPELRDMVTEEVYSNRLCKDYSPTFFFPPSQTDIEALGDNVILFPKMEERAKTICRDCECSWLCYLAADLRGTNSGIFGAVDFSNFNEVN